MIRILISILEEMKEIFLLALISCFRSSIKLALKEHVLQQ